MSTKERVLELLELKRGEILSGEYIAGILGISRSSVWKAVKELKKEGYKIEAGTNKGYSLLSVNDIISRQGIRACLPFTSGAGEIHIYKTLESTNKTAKEMAVANAPHGTVIIADSQTLGRGRYGRSFFSPPGCGLYMSFILRPENLIFFEAEMATVFAAVSVCRAIEKACGKQAGIKWVNDVFYNGKKVCGILTEGAADFESGVMQWIVIGIGINVSEPPEGFPEDIRKIVGALYAGGDIPVTRNELAAALINEALNAKQSEEDILNEYRERLIMLGKEITVLHRDGNYTATAIGIDDKGHLLVRKENGETDKLFSGEISIRI